MTSYSRARRSRRQLHRTIDFLSLSLSSLSLSLLSSLLSLSLRSPSCTRSPHTHHNIHKETAEASGTTTTTKPKTATAGGGGEEIVQIPDTHTPSEVNWVGVTC